MLAHGLCDIRSERFNFGTRRKTSFIAGCRQWKCSRRFAILLGPRPCSLFSRRTSAGSIGCYSGAFPHSTTGARRSGMADSILTIEQMADWISPSQAVEILKAAYNDLYLAKETLLERLRGGMVRSISEETVIEGARPHRTMHVQIPAAHWKNIQSGKRAISPTNFSTIIRHIDQRPRLDISMCVSIRLPFVRL
jgi:hypothetical protein